jgi:hypothetical protein
MEKSAKPASNTPSERRRRARTVMRALLVIGVWFATVVWAWNRGGLHDRPVLVLAILSGLSIAVFVVAAAAPWWVAGPQPALEPPPDYPGSRLIERSWPWGMLLVGLVLGALVGVWSVRLFGTRMGVWAGAIIGASCIADVWSWRWVHRRLALPLRETWIPFVWLAIVLETIQSLSSATRTGIGQIAYLLVCLPAVSAWIYIWGAYVSARLVRALLDP